MITYKIVFAATLLVTGLAAGLFYSYSVSINPGLHRVSDNAYMESMQHINRAILNPAFFASFMGTLILLPVCTWMAYKNDGPWMWLAAATLLYAVGTFGVTIACNVPLNNLLDKGAIERAQFEIPWTKWHAVRTLAAVLSFLCSVCAAIFK